MKLALVIVTRNKSVSVKTLHTILRFNVKSLQKQHQVSILYTDDNATEKSKNLAKAFKSSDRVIYVGYSASVDNDSIEKLLEPYPAGYNGLVLPAVTEGVDWNLFKKKTLDGSTEPAAQMGMDFDTEVDKPIKNTDMWTVKKTDPKVWSLDSKQTIKSLRERKGDGFKVPHNHSDLFTKIKTCAFTKARVTLTYTHECLGNILESAGVKKS